MVISSFFFDPRASPSQPAGGDLSSEAKEGGRGSKGRGETEKRRGRATPEYNRQGCWDICGCCRCMCLQSRVVYAVVMKFEFNHFPSNTHTRTHTHTHQHTHILSRAHAYTHTHKHTHTPHALTCTCAHAYTHTHTHTHTLQSLQIQLKSPSKLCLETRKTCVLATQHQMMCLLLKVLVGVQDPALPVRETDLRGHHLGVGVATVHSIVILKMVVHIPFPKLAHSHVSM